MFNRKADRIYELETKLRKAEFCPYSIKITEGVDRYDWAVIQHANVVPSSYGLIGVGSYDIELLRGTASTRTKAEYKARKALIPYQMSSPSTTIAVK